MNYKYKTLRFKNSTAKIILVGQGSNIPMKSVFNQPNNNTKKEKKNGWVKYFQFIKF